MKLLLLIIFFISQLTALSQTNCEYEDEYIPKNLTDALQYLTCTWSNEDKNNFKLKDEQDAVSELHFGTGLAIRNNWNLWKGNNSLYRFFKSKGITHPDDISSIILTSFHRQLNNKNINLEKQIKFYKDYWEQANKEYDEKEAELNKTLKNEFEGYSLGDSVIIDFNIHPKKNYIHAYPVQGHPDLGEQGNCKVLGIVTGKRIRRKKDYTLKIKIIDICGNEKVYWGSIHDRHGDFQINKEYNFFSIKSFKINKQ